MYGDGEKEIKRETEESGEERRKVEEGEGEATRNEETE